MRNYNKKWKDEEGGTKMNQQRKGEHTAQMRLDIQRQLGGYMGRVRPGKGGRRKEHKEKPTHDVKQQKYGHAERLQWPRRRH